MSRRLQNLVNSSAKPEIDFTDSRNADPKIGFDAKDAVEKLDYETAEKITDNAHLKSHNFIRDTSNQIMNDIEKKDIDMRISQQMETERIELQAEIKAEDIKHNYQTKFTQLVLQHRKEAEALKEKWIQDHQRAEALALKKISELKDTSKVLATCESYVAAKDLRDRATINEEQLISEETDAVDEHFRLQFESMMERHNDAYNSLYNEMMNKIHFTKQKAKLKSQKLDVETTYKEALSPVEMMNKISKSPDLSIIEKTSIIKQITPSRRNTPMNSRAVSELT